jgi:DNA-binding response OmpR family regulator
VKAGPTTTPVLPVVLIVEDDAHLRLGLKDNLEDEGYRVLTASNAAEARSALAEMRADLVILDIMLPDTDGYALCRALRSEGLASMILMLTARSLEEDLVRGFEAGADDYVSKPYRLAELLMRVRALLRRAGAAPLPRLDAFGGFVLHREARRVVDARGTAVEFTRKELDLLLFLVDQRGRALSRDEILDAVWGADVVVDHRTVDNFVSSLKKKLGWSPASAFRIATVRGVGYRMEIVD